MTAYLDLPGPRAFAHRGWHIGDLSGCENSLAAFRRAADEGYRYLETDVQLTADGVLVAFHDDRLDRMTGHRGLLADLPWDRVRAARIGGREPVPRFEELLELLRDRPALRLNVDAKSDAAVAPLVALITASGVAERICVASFSDTRLQRLRAALGPDVASSLGPRQVGRLVATAGLRPRFGSAVAVQVPPRFRRLPVVGRPFLSAAHRAGLEVHVWTINDAASIRGLLDLGVDGVMTDRPDTLRTVLVQRGQW